MDDRLWHGPAPLAVTYVFAANRSAREIAGQLATFGGILRVDSYAASRLMLAESAKRRLFSALLMHGAGSWRTQIN